MPAKPLITSGFVELQASNDHALKILESYANFWKVPYCWSEEKTGRSIGAIFAAGCPNEETNLPVVVSPLGFEDAKRIAENNGFDVRQTQDTSVTLPFARGVPVSIRTTAYEFEGSSLEPIIKSGRTTVLSKISGENQYFLSIDLVNCHTRLMQGIEDKPHLRFRLVSRLGAYTLVPQFLRNRLFRDEDGLEKLREDTIAPMECLRAIFLASIVRASGNPVPILGFWRKGKEHALAVTHDVESREGLEVGSWQLLDVEERFAIRSTWNLPSHRYPIEGSSISKLAELGELGGHDTRHDGKLILTKSDEKVRRLSDCRETLERTSGQTVAGFRAPLLQHDAQLLEAVGKAGFTHDSSIPSWEALSPTSLGPHGIGTVFPFMFSGVLEIPVSLPQDHQLLRVMGLSPKESVDALHRLSNWVDGLGGSCVLLVHPDYEFAWPGNKTEYQRLLQKFANDPSCDIMTLGGVAKWWTFRDSVRWTVDGDKLRLTSPTGSVDDIQAKHVVGYDDVTGFKMEELS